MIAMSDSPAVTADASAALVDIHRTERSRGRLGGVGGIVSGWPRIARVRRTAAVFALSAWPTLAAAGDVGVVLSVHGKPSATDVAGHWRRAEVLQGVHEGETVVFDPGETLVVCNGRRRAAVRIEGPGTVSIGAATIAVLVGAPRITEAGPCDDAGAADQNGGVILRSLSHAAPPGRR